jgi:hypothetical protein
VDCRGQAIQAFIGIHQGIVDHIGQYPSVFGDGVVGEAKLPVAETMDDVVDACILSILGMFDDGSKAISQTGEVRKTTQGAIS